MSRILFCTIIVLLALPNLVLGQNDGRDHDGDSSLILDPSIGFSVNDGLALQFFGGKVGIEYSNDYYALIPEHEFFAKIQAQAVYANAGVWVLPRSRQTAANPVSANSATIRYTQTGVLGELNQVLLGDRYHNVGFVSLGLYGSALAILGIDSIPTGLTLPGQASPGNLLFAAATDSFFGDVGVRLRTRINDDQFFPTYNLINDTRFAANFGANGASEQWLYASLDSTVYGRIPLIDRYLAIRPSIQFAMIAPQNPIGLPWFAYPRLNGVRGLTANLKDLVTTMASVEMVSEFLYVEIPARGSLGLVGFFDAGALEGSIEQLAPARMTLSAGGYAELKLEIPLFKILLILKVGLAALVYDGISINNPALRPAWDSTEPYAFFFSFDAAFRDTNL